MPQAIWKSISITDAIVPSLPNLAIVARSVESLYRFPVNSPTTDCHRLMVLPYASPVSFSWGAINYSGVQYELQIAYDRRL